MKLSPLGGSSDDNEQEGMQLEDEELSKRLKRLQEDPSLELEDRVEEIERGFFDLDSKMDALRDDWDRFSEEELGELWDEMEQLRQRMPEEKPASKTEVEELRQRVPQGDILTEKELERRAENMRQEGLKGKDEGEGSAADGEEIEDIRSVVESLDERIDELERSESNGQSKRLEKISSELDSLSDDVDGLIDERVSKLESRVEELERSDLSQLETEVEGARSLGESNREVMEELQNELEKVHSLAKGEEEDLREEVSELDHRVSSLRKELEVNGGSGDVEVGTPENLEKLEHNLEQFIRKEKDSELEEIERMIDGVSRGSDSSSGSHDMASKTPEKILDRQEELEQDIQELRQEISEARVDRKEFEELRSSCRRMAEVLRIVINDSGRRRKPRAESAGNLF